MRSFSGRDILSFKDFERNEFFHVFDVARSWSRSLATAATATCWQKRPWSPPFTSPAPALAWRTKLPCTAWVVM